MKKHAFTWPIRVYYEDTDAGGVVYHASYLRFFERARTEWLRALGIEQRQWASQHQLLFAVTEMSVKFRRPAKLDDALIASCALIERRGASLKFEQRLLRAADQLLLVEASVRAACLDAVKLRPVAIPKNILLEH